MGYNLQEKVQVLAYTFHNLSSSKLIFSSKRQFHLHSSVIPISHAWSISNTDCWRVTIPLKPALNFLFLMKSIPTAETIYKEQQVRW